MIDMAGRGEKRMPESAAAARGAGPEAKIWREWPGPLDLFRMPGSLSSLLTDDLSKLHGRLLQRREQCWRDAGLAEHRRDVLIIQVYGMLFVFPHERAQRHF